jgi:methionyl-tRNA formyltransferase
MRLVFFGTSSFALPSLEAIAKSQHQILAVVTQPDRERGRNLSLSSPPVKTLARQYHLKIEQPIKISSPDFMITLKNYNADLFVVIAFGQILNREVLKIPKYFCINLHGSLLPKYRGPAPINWAIINGETKTGVSIIKMDREVDHGDIIFNKEVEIEPRDNAMSLGQKLSKVGASVLIEALNLIEQNRASFCSQEEKEATFAPKLKKSDGLIRWSEKAFNLHNKVRGLFPWPGIFTYFNDKTLKILESEVIPSKETVNYSPGTVINIREEGIVVQTGQGLLLLKQVQLEGSKAMSAKQFSLGHHIEIGTELLGKPLT